MFVERAGDPNDAGLSASKRARGGKGHRPSALTRAGNGDLSARSNMDILAAARCDEASL